MRYTPVIEAIPDWVEKVDISPSGTAPNAKRHPNVETLLLDYQFDSRANAFAEFRRVVQRANSISNLADLSPIQIQFVPEFQNVILHGISVYRGGECTDRLFGATFDLIQRETNLESRVFDGTHTLAITMQDLQAGDTIEYSYSIRGANPIFEGKLHFILPLQWAVYIERIHVRLSIEENRNINIQPADWGVIAQSARPGFKTFVCNLENIEPYLPEPNMPANYVPFSYLEVSEYSDWQQVIKWALPLFETPSYLDMTLIEEVNQVTDGILTKNATIAAILRFVDRKIRYHAIGLGENLIRPHPPNLVFQRKFGDCKDKSLLIHCLLHHFGIKSAPVLVNTGLTDRILEFAPSPLVFNHCVILVEADDREFLIDPTLPFDASDLSGIIEPDFKCGLAVASDEKTLRRFAPPENYGFVKDVTEVFAVPAGENPVVQFSVRSKYTSLAYLQMKSNLENKSSAEINRDNIAYFSRFYPGIRVAEDLTVESIPEKAELIIIEKYEIEDLWKVSDGNTKRLEAAFLPLDISDALLCPESKSRNHPWAVFPANISVKTILKMPTHFPLQLADSEIDDDHFALSTKSTSEGNDIILETKYRTKATVVLAQNMARYYDRVAEARSKLGISLWSAQTATGNFVSRNAGPIIAGIAFAILYILAKLT
ncbi:MAG: DUF3857 domain-containing protein [Spirochaetota bacterium]